MNNGIAVYPGTFDPFTRGHEDLVRRAARLFSRVIVGIAASHGKRPLFTLDERVEIARELCADLPNVEVFGFTGLLMDFLREQRASRRRSAAAHTDGCARICCAIGRNIRSGAARSALPAGLAGAYGNKKAAFRRLVVLGE